MENNSKIIMSLKLALFIFFFVAIPFTVVSLPWLIPLLKNASGEQIKGLIEVAFYGMLTSLLLSIYVVYSEEEQQQPKKRRYSKQNQKGQFSSIFFGQVTKGLLSGISIKKLLRK